MKNSAENLYRLSRELGVLADWLESKGYSTKQIRAVELRLSERAYRIKEK
jgi:hypothetical protein